VRHREDALDAVQEVFVRVHRNHRDLRDASRERRWLYKIATNVAHDLLSRRQRTPQVLGDRPADGPCRVLGSSRPEPLPLASLEAIETTARLESALAELPSELRQPLVLFAVSGLKYREVAEALGSPLGTVTTRIREARRRLAIRLGERVECPAHADDDHS
jgi:RNA polymerase sigma-70 factor (ECF subfamily)